MSGSFCELTESERCAWDEASFMIAFYSLKTNDFLFPDELNGEEIEIFACLIRYDKLPHWVSHEFDVRSLKHVNYFEIGISDVFYEAIIAIHAEMWRRYLLFLKQSLQHYAGFIQCAQGYYYGLYLCRHYGRHEKVDVTSKEQKTSHRGDFTMGDFLCTVSRELLTRHSDVLAIGSFYLCFKREIGVIYLVR